MDGKPAETLVNDVEDSPIPMGSAWTPLAPSDLPSGSFAFGFSEVATLRWVRPGEAFVTPRSGMALDSHGALVRRANYHRVYAGQQARCIEVWQHPCTPNDAMDFTCATTPVDFVADQTQVAAGQQLFVVGNIPELGGWDPTHAIPLTGGPTTWRTTISLPQSVQLEFKLVKRDAAGNVFFESGANRTFEVPVAPAASTTGTFR
jgi:hypothetical protein